MKTKLKAFDVTEWLDSEEMIAEYLNAALEEGDTEYFLKALGHVAKARGMTQIAKNSGLGRASLYKALSGGRSPKFSTIQKITEAMGVHLKVSV